jgi:hypothetical protein
MPRNLSPSFLAACASGQVRLGFFLRIQFLTETVYIWSGRGSITPAGPAWDSSSSFPYGQAFTGFGWMGSIGSIPSVTDVIATNITLVLSGIPTELLTDAINAVRQNSIATLWLALSDANGNVIADPVQVFQGTCDVPTTKEGAVTSTLSITCENPLIDLNRAPSRRYTDVDQQITYPGDTGFFQVQLLQDFLLLWPAPYGNNNSDSTEPPNYLTITPGQTSPVEVPVGLTQQLTVVETRPDGSTNTIMKAGYTYGGGPVYSSDPTLATVDVNGLVTGVKPGMCIVTKRFVESEYLGSGPSRPSNCVTASVTIIVTQP